MTDFAALLLVEDAAPASPLVLLGPDTLEDWLRNAPERSRALVAAHGFKAAADEVLLLPGDGPGEVMALAGLGTSPGPFALAAAAQRLPAGRWRPSGEAPLLGWLLAQHQFNRYRTASPKGPRILLTTAPAARGDAIALAQAMALARDLIDTPAADMGPAALAAAAAEQAKQFGANLDVVTGQALIDRNFPLIHAVGRAGDEAPRLIDLSWGQPDHPRLTLVGKGITFDSGGLNIKPTGAMALMKKDMGGAATALALARLVMQAGLKVRLRLLIPAAENSIDSRAMRPGDVLASRAGKSIEITNTDAEGRLVLADALCLAMEDKPDLLLDFATLTGAARVALGPELPALFTPDETLAADLAAAATATDDPLWRLPLWPGYAEQLKSSIADMVNSAEGPFAGAITAALFLQAFVPQGTAWAHLDTYAWNGKARPGRPKGGEALALRAAFAMIKARFG
jgi:leucyl aminopeptidase